MKMPKRLIASLGVLMISATPLLASADPRDDHDHGGPQQGHYDDRGGDHHDWQSSHRGDPPPRDFGPVRQVIRDNHGYFVRGAPPPPGIRLERGRPLPHGYY